MSKLDTDFHIPLLYVFVFVIALILAIAIAKLKDRVGALEPPRKTETVAVVREKYYRGDIVKLTNGSQAWISDKSLRVGDGKEWNYEVNATGMKKQWIPELSIESVVKESPTRPKMEKQ
jgi:protein involved in temperature-dependent protein secretion